MPDVVLIRPGCTDFDEQKRIQGSLDLPLNSRGQEQVETLIQKLRTVDLDVIYSGPCEPARSTAVALSEELGATHKEVEDFGNVNHGLWQGLQVEDVRRKFPKVFKQWQEMPETVCLPEGETVADAVCRVQRALKKCIKRKKKVAIVASEPLATLIRCVLCGCKPELPCTDHGPRACLIEIVHVPDEDSAKGETAFVRSSSEEPASSGKSAGPSHAQNGAPLNGNGAGKKPNGASGNGNGHSSSHSRDPQGNGHDAGRQA